MTAPVPLQGISRGGLGGREGRRRARARAQALNRGENYHQLRRAVSYANFGKLRFRTEYEQQLWGECSRLLTNGIIYYNMTILSHLWAHKESSGDGHGAALSCAFILPTDTGVIRPGRAPSASADGPAAGTSS